MTQKQLFFDWMQRNEFMKEERNSILYAKKNILVRSKNEIYQIFIEYDQARNGMTFKLDLRRKIDNSSSFVTLSINYILFTEWQEQVKNALKPLRLNRSLDYGIN